MKNSRGRKACPAVQSLIEQKMPVWGAKMETGAAEERFIAAAVSICDIAPNPSRRAATLQAVADSFGEVVGTVLPWQQDNGGLGTIVSPSLKAA